MVVKHKLFIDNALDSGDGEGFLLLVLTRRFIDQLLYVFVAVSCCMCLLLSAVVCVCYCQLLYVFVAISYCMCLLQDVIAYRALDIPSFRIFTINPQGQLRHDLSHTFLSS